MANIGTTTIKITPEFDTTALAALEDTMREAVAASLRRLADELTVKPVTGESTPASPEPALWGYHIGDRVYYTDGYITNVRIIKSVEAGTLALADEEGYLMGYAYRAADIRPE